MGVLVQLGDRAPTAWHSSSYPALGLAWRATFVDITGGDPKKAGMNVLLIVSATRSVLCPNTWHPS